MKNVELSCVNDICGYKSISVKRYTDITLTTSTERPNPVNYISHKGHISLTLSTPEIC